MNSTSKISFGQGSSITSNASSLSPVEKTRSNDDLETLLKELRFSPELESTRSRTYRTYSAESPRSAYGATPLPEGNLCPGKESPDTSLIIRISIDTIRNEINNISDLDSRKLIHNHLNTLQETLETPYINRRIDLLLNTPHLNKQDLSELEAYLNFVVLEFDILLSPVTKQRSLGKQDLSPSLTLATSSVAARNLPSSPKNYDPTNFKPLDQGLSSPFINWEMGLPHEKKDSEVTEADGNK
jgi:hypothetical protein